MTSCARRMLRGIRCLVAAVAAATCLAATAAEPLALEPYGHLQAELDSILADMGLEQAAVQGRLAVALVELDNRQPRSLAMVNGHRMMYAASLPKIAILYGAAVALDEGRIELDEALHQDLIAMIRQSCNPCATRVLEHIGRSWLLELLQEGRHRFYDPETGGGLWVGKDYARGRAFERDPLFGLSHGATAWQTARWYYLLVNGELASPERTDLMLEALSDPAIAHKFVKGLAGQETSAMYRKSGTWKRFHADSVLIEAGEHCYILVALSDDSRGGRWMEELARRVHEHVTGGQHLPGAG